MYIHIKHTPLFSDNTATLITQIEAQCVSCLLYMVAQRQVKYNRFSKSLVIVSRLQHASDRENIWHFFKKILNRHLHEGVKFALVHI